MSHMKARLLWSKVVRSLLGGNVRWVKDRGDWFWLVVGSGVLSEGNEASQSTAGNGGNHLAGGRGLREIQGL